MKYPKLRDGPTAIGESHIRALHQVSDALAPFLTKEGPDGTIAYKKNGFDEVHLRATIDGYFCLGDLGDTSTVYVMASPTARGAFTNRGAQSGVQNFVIPQLDYVGKGFCLVPRTRTSVNYANFFKTKDGRSFSLLDITFGPLGLQSFGLSVGYYIQLPNAGVYRSTPTDPKIHNFGFSYLFDLGAEPPVNSIPVFAVYQDGSFVLGAPLAYPGASMSVPQVMQAGPGSMYALTCSYANGVDEFGLVGAPFFSKSIDMGVTWAFVPSGTLFDNILALRATAVSTAGLTERRRLVENWQQGLGFMKDLVHGASLNPDTFSVVMPLMDSLEWLTSGDPGHGMPYIALTMDGSSIATTFIFPFRFPDTTIASMFHFKGAVYMQTSDATEHALWKTTNGTDWTMHTALPFASCNTGFISFDSTKRMLLPVFDGDYSLYESLDEGLTWRKRATIHKTNYFTIVDGEGVSATVPAPNPAWRSLQRFGVLNFVSQGGVPAPLFPQAPWIGDSDKVFATP